MEQLAMKILLPVAVAEECSFAVEYSGPPVPYDEIPRAMPIEMERIPVAAAVAASHHRLHLPVVQPLPSPKKPPPAAADAVPAVASPKSVIGNRDGLDGEISGEIPDRPLEPPGGGDGLGVSSFSGEVKGSEGSSSSGDLPEIASTDSGLSSDFRCSAFDDVSASSTTRATTVTLRSSADRSGIASSPAAAAGSVCGNSESGRVSKGSCCRCLRGNRFTEKEACFVCDAKYCGRCVLRAMGSMPEGRKCVSCIGFPIEESKREKLGKNSRLLKRLLSALEVQQVMRAEQSCEANQLRPEDVCVNGKQLSKDEMFLLQSCAIPPLKLRPGHYWYDKVSGFWGKEGYKPHRIISPNLNVGGSLMKNASHGNAGILVNGREITKVELQMLKWAGVQCAGNPHFWLNADGTYQEEGQKNIKGQIWDKPGLKLVCSVLSLPFPYKVEQSAGKVVYKMVDRVLPVYLEHRTEKVLLVGHLGSGTSTIFKQAKFLYRGIPFTDEEREDIKFIIQSNVYRFLAILLEGRERFEEECLIEKRREVHLMSSFAGDAPEGECVNSTEYSIGPRLNAFSDWILKVMASGNLEAIFPAATREYAPVVEELWNDAAIQATYARRHELELLPDVASYFLGRVVDISKPEYEPSDMDILRAGGITPSNALACTDFFFPPIRSDASGADVDDQEDTRVRHQLIRLHTRALGGEHFKWLDMFEDAQLVIFCVALSDYNEFHEDASGARVNKLVAAARLFESIATNPAFDQMDFLLILNKFDVLEQKIDSSPLSLCDWLADFRPVMSRNANNGRGARNDSTMAQLAFHHVAVKFKRLFAYLTGKKLYVAPANALDSDSVDAALRYGGEILKWREEAMASGWSEYSTYSNDPGSFSP